MVNRVKLKLRLLHAGCEERHCSKKLPLEHANVQITTIHTHYTVAQFSNFAVLDLGFIFLSLQLSGREMGYYVQVLE